MQRLIGCTWVLLFIWISCVNAKLPSKPWLEIWRHRKSIEILPSSNTSHPRFANKTKYLVLPKVSHKSKWKKPKYTSRGNRRTWSLYVLKHRRKTRKGHVSSEFIYRPQPKVSPGVLMEQITAYHKKKETKTVIEDSNIVDQSKSNKSGPLRASTNIPTIKRRPKWILWKTLYYPVAYASNLADYSLILGVVSNRFLSFWQPKKMNATYYGPLFIEDRPLSLNLTVSAPVNVSGFTSHPFPVTNATSVEGTPVNQTTTTEMNLSRDVEMLNQVLKLRLKKLQKTRARLSIILITLSVFVWPLMCAILVYILIGFYSY